MASAFPGGIDSLPDITNPTVTDCNVAPTLSTRLNLVQEAMTAVETWLLANSPLWLPPSGLIMAFAGTTAPSGYLMCDGSLVSRTTFQNLFNAIGTTYGSGDGSTTFGVPNLLGKVIVGAVSAISPSFPLATTGGEYTHTLTAVELASHSHPVTSPTHVHGITDGGHSHTVTAFSGTIQGLQTGGATFFIPATVNTSVVGTGISINAASAGITTTGAFGNNNPHNNVQPYLALNYVIKT